MNRLLQFWARIYSLYRKRRLDTEMDEEIRLHIEMQTEENIEAGMAPDEARYAALRRFIYRQIDARFV